MELSSSGSSLSLDSWKKSEKSMNTTPSPSRSPGTCRPPVPQTLLSLPNSNFHNLNLNLKSPTATSNVQRAGSRSSLDPIMGKQFYLFFLKNVKNLTSQFKLPYTLEIKPGGSIFQNGFLGGVQF